MDEVEVVHGYTDVTDAVEFVRRAKEQQNLGREDEILAEMLAEGRVPPDSSGFGIGIERFCQVCLGRPDIRDFVSSTEF